MTRSSLTTVFALALGLSIAGMWGCRGGSVDEVADGHTEADDHGEVRVVHLEPAALEQVGIEVAVAGPGDLDVTTELPGEVQVNGDRMAHISPRVGGVVKEVHASLGDTVRAGQLLAVLESSELADAKAAFLAATERLRLANATFDREERLFHSKVSSEQDYLDARKLRAETRIELRAAGQKLQALGVAQTELEVLPDQHDTELTIYRLTAPFSGTVIDRHITLGETVAAERPVFTVADLSTVWIDLSVYQKDIGAVRAGQRARVTTGHGDETELEISFVQPLVGEETRTALARIEAPNPDGDWHPGCFVTARISTSTDATARVVVPATAVIRMEDGDEVIFVETGDGFEPRHVEVGRQTRDDVEIVSGLAPGERYVLRGGFSLKAELAKESFGAGHGH